MNILKGKKAVVIGGSRGINKEVARAFLKEGADVIIVSRTKSELVKTTKELSALGSVDFYVADVAKFADMKKLATQVLKKWKNIDILVNGAAIPGPIGRVTDIDPKKWAHSIQVSLSGTFHGVKVFGPAMIKAKNGVIINYVGGGEGPMLNHSSYVAAKGGIARFTETVAVEFKDFGIRVNAIAPGAVNTFFLENLIKVGPKKAGEEHYRKALEQKNNGGVSPEKAAQLCVWLASDASRGVTGKILSAQWDPYTDFPKHLSDISNTDVYTMRRVRPTSKGFDWDPFDRPAPKKK